MTQELILASSSRYRVRLFERLGLPFRALSPSCDEDTPGLSPLQIPAVLARRKALSLRESFPNAHILGSDQIALVEGQVLGKPGSKEAAAKQLAQLEGRQHELLTAVALACPDGSCQVARCTFRMTMRSLEAGEIDRYLDADQPFDCCGSYKIETLGISLFSSVEGDDVTAIEGLPLISVSRLLRDAGFSVP